MGPRTEPWGTPKWKETEVEELPTLKNCLRSEIGMKPRKSNFRNVKVVFKNVQHIRMIESS